MASRGWSSSGSVGDRLPQPTPQDTEAALLSKATPIAPAERGRAAFQQDLLNICALKLLLHLDERSGSQRRQPRPFPRCRWRKIPCRRTVATPPSRGHSTSRKPLDDRVEINLPRRHAGSMQALQGACNHDYCRRMIYRIGVTPALLLTLRIQLGV